ncbi:MAG: OmpA family protein [Deltaproteobacteria bacterium]|nr:OmpA family protein [Deltaproteobacteria bacterium]
MRTKFLILAALTAMFCFPSLASAQMKENTLHLSMMAGAIFPRSVDIDNGAVFGLGFGYNFTKNWGIEAFAHYAPSLDDQIYDNTLRGYPDIDLLSGRLNGIYHFDLGTNFVPYITLGLGGVKGQHSHDDDYNSGTANGGLGFKYFFDTNVALRLEANELVAFRSVDGHRLTAPSITAGLTFQFGQPTGCVDEDKDGVCDPYDKCPGTPLNYRVDSDGCPIRVTRTLNILFDFDKDVIKPQYTSEVQGAAQFLQTHPGSTARIEGYTDDRGNDDYNQRLSERRANAVLTSLINNFGIDASRISAVGFGEQNPIDTNTTAAGRANNRRVVGVFEGTDVDQ